MKSQIGHTKTAAGAAGMVKAALALHHKVLPPTINVERPNPAFALETSPFYLNTEPRPWIRVAPDVPRRAGVSSFGFGGTNFHVVLEEHGAEPAAPYRLHALPSMVVLHAPDREALLARCEGLCAALNEPEGARAYRQLLEEQQEAEPVPTGHARLGFVAESQASCAALLATAAEQLRTDPSAAWEHPRGLYFRQAGLDLEGRVVALFPGQGAQTVGMGRELAQNYPAVRQAFERADAARRRRGLEGISPFVFPPPARDAEDEQAQRDRLTRTENAQPAIGALSAGLFGLLRQAGFRPDFVAGHSFGELSALWASGALGEEAFFDLAVARGQAMAAKSEEGFDAGAMLAVMAGSEALTDLVAASPDVQVANDNAPQQTVVAGPTPAIERFEARLTAEGYDARRLPVSAAFHTPLVAHAQKPFAQAVSEAAFTPPEAPVYRNATATAYPRRPEEIAEALAEQMLCPVLFKKGVEQIYNDGGFLFVEFGPRQVLTKLVRATLQGRPHLAVALNPSPGRSEERRFRQALVQLRVAGLALGEVDPHQAPRPAAEASKKGFTVKLNASGYTSDRTKERMRQALDGPASSASEAASRLGPSACPRCRTPSCFAPDVRRLTRLRRPARHDTLPYAPPIPLRPTGLAGTACPRGEAGAGQPRPRAGLGAG